MLERSHIASCRLNLQHYLWKTAIGYNVHPSIPITSATIVADIAAGTGMWLVDMAQSYPTVQFEGFDNNLVIDTLLF
jgi:ubiquinone/menaquinone biosynthesis C-methylase UbiE